MAHTFQYLAQGWSAWHLTSASIRCGERRSGGRPCASGGACKHATQPPARLAPHALPPHPPPPTYLLAVRVLADVQRGVHVLASRRAAPAGDCAPAGPPEWRGGARRGCNQTTGVVTGAAWGGRRYSTRRAAVQLTAPHAPHFPPTHILAAPATSVHQTSSRACHDRQGMLRWYTGEQAGSCACSQLARCMVRVVAEVVGRVDVAGKHRHQVVHKAQACERRTKCLGHLAAGHRELLDLLLVAVLGEAADKQAYA